MLHKFRIMLHDAPSFSNTRSHCNLERMERISGKEMEVGEGKNLDIEGKAGRIKEKVLC